MADTSVPCLRPVHRGLRNGEIQGRGFYDGRENFISAIECVGLTGGVLV